MLIYSPYSVLHKGQLIMFLFHDKSSFCKQFCLFVLFFKQSYLYFCLLNLSVACSSLARGNWQETMLSSFIQLGFLGVLQNRGQSSLVDLLDQS